MLFPKGSEVKNACKITFFVKKTTTTRYINFMPPVKVDSHVHLTSDVLFQDIDEVIARALSNHVFLMININTNRLEVEKGMGLQARYCGHIFNAGGTHPHDVAALGEVDFPFFRQLALQKKLIAVGEVGLDYFYGLAQKGIQKKFLLLYAELAQEANLPLIIHCRGEGAMADLLVLLKGMTHVVVHCFSGTLKEAEILFQCGWHVSVGGILTFKKSDYMREVFRNISLDKVLLETDAPFLAPQSKRGKRNEPSFLQEVAEVLACVKNLSVEEVCEKTTRNARSFFGLFNEAHKKEASFVNEME